MQNCKFLCKFTPFRLPRPMDFIPPTEPGTARPIPPSPNTDEGLPQAGEGDATDYSPPPKQANMSSPSLSPSIIRNQNTPAQDTSPVRVPRQLSFRTPLELGPGNSPANSPEGLIPDLDMYQLDTPPAIPATPAMTPATADTPPAAHSPMDVPPRSPPPGTPARNMQPHCTTRIPNRFRGFDMTTDEIICKTGDWASASCLQDATAQGAYGAPGYKTCTRYNLMYHMSVIAYTTLFQVVRNLPGRSAITRIIKCNSTISEHYFVSK